MHTDMTHGAGDVLVVDDEPVILDLLFDVLTDEGYAVRTAHNGLEGWRAIEQAPPALLLLDVMMPVMDGAELAIRVRAAKYTFPIVIIAATPRLAAPLMALPRTMYIEKPFQLSVLLAVVREIMAVEVGVLN